MNSKSVNYNSNSNVIKLKIQISNMIMENTSFIFSVRCFLATKTAFNYLANYFIMYREKYATSEKIQKRVTRVIFLSTRFAILVMSAKYIIFNHYRDLYYTYSFKDQY